MSTLKKNSIYNLIGSALPMLVGLVTIPFLIKHLGVEKFGILSIIWALIGYFSIFDFGIGRALTHGVASYRAENQNSINYKLISSGLKATFFSGIIGGLILALISFPLAYNWLNATASLQDELFTSILLTSIGIPFVTYTSGLKGILEGYETFRTINVIKAILGILNFLLPVISIYIYGPSLIHLVIGLITIRVIIFGCHLKVLSKIINIKKAIFSLDKTGGKEKLEIYKFGAWMTLSNILSPLMVTSDRFLISYFLGASVVAYYTVPFDLAIRVLIIPASLTTTLFPKFSGLINNNIGEAKATFYSSIKQVQKGMFLLTLFMIIFSYLGLSFWISSAFADKSWLILIIISVGIFFNGIAQVPHTFLQAASKVKLTALVHSIEFIFYIIILLGFLKYFGIIGAAVAFSLRVFLDYFVLNFFVNKFLKKRI